MYCLFIVIFLANSFSCLSTVVKKLMKMLLSDPGDQAGIYLKKLRILLELVCLFGILFHVLLRLSTYLIFVKKLNHYSLMF